MSSIVKKCLAAMSAHDYNSGGFNKAILAIGSTESHGEHLPYGTDTFVAEYLAKTVAERVEGLIVLPTVPIGMSEHYSSFPIAISLTTQTLIKVIWDILESLFSHDILKLLIVNGHDGNIAAIEAATREFRISHPEMKIAVLEAWWITAGELLPNDTFEAWGGLGHGGEGETSMMLAVAPELVCMERAKGVMPKLPEYIQLKWTFNELTPYAATGDPTKATLEKGKMMRDALVDSLVSFIDRMEKQDWSITYS
jgi:creatinine amidohydrolase